MGGYNNPETAFGCLNLLFLHLLLPPRRSSYYVIGENPDCHKSNHVSNDAIHKMYRRRLATLGEED